MTKYEKIREKEIARILANTADPGRFARVEELLAPRPNSKKTKVSAQGKTDFYIAIRYDEKVRYIGAERKTNGGRVEAIINGTQKEKFVVYSLDFTQKYKATKTAPAREENRKIPAVVIPTDLFRSLLLELGCYKDMAHGGKIDGIGIQPSSKKLYERLAAYVENYGDAVLFDNTKIFDNWALEGLEL